MPTIKEEMRRNRLLMMIAFVCQVAHYAQKRKNDENMPYSIHPISMASNVIITDLISRAEEITCSGVVYYLQWHKKYHQIGVVSFVQIVAMLHDVLEDCNEQDLKRAWTYLQQHYGQDGLFGPDWNEDLPKEKMLAKIVDFCVRKCGYEHKPMFDAQQTTGDWVVETVLELTVPKGAHPDGHYEEGDKPARKAWERSFDRMRRMSLSALIVTLADKYYNLNSPMEGRDMTVAEKNYGEYFQNILLALSMEYGIGYETDKMPHDMYHAMQSFRQG